MPAGRLVQTISQSNIAFHAKNLVASLGAMVHDTNRLVIRNLSTGAVLVDRHWPSDSLKVSASLPSKGTIPRSLSTTPFREVNKNCPNTPERCPDWIGTLSEPLRIAVRMLPDCCPANAGTLSDIRRNAVRIESESCPNGAGIRTLLKNPLPRGRTDIRQLTRTSMRSTQFSGQWKE